MPDAAAPLNKGDILVVDDDPAIVSFVVDSLIDAGYLVRSALSGRAGMQAINERAPALVLLDLRMAGLPGDDILVYLRSVHRRVPVVIITANPELAKPLVERYKIECIAKPFELDTLLDCVRRYMSPGGTDAG
jgi:DNA-binding NtrC family response regulator